MGEGAGGYWFRYKETKKVGIFNLYKLTLKSSKEYKAKKKNPRNICTFFYISERNIKLFALEPLSIG